MRGALTSWEIRALALLLGFGAAIGAVIGFWTYDEAGA